ncbi:MAG: Set3 complex subunit with deacetylase activity, meiotic-specific repressor of sporulation proteins [Thelocarpon impressellum]|nr:MAG: Set3 complex subunit with deacetylase activity, meiotic-specific repressor of sporulation proteins [Thelocarpon impressellum]
MSSPGPTTSPPSKPAAETGPPKNGGENSKGDPLAPPSKPITSSPPGAVPSKPPSKEQGADGDVPGEKGSAKSDSEAETIVLPGKENDATPTKRRTIKHEDDSEPGEVHESGVGGRKENGREGGVKVEKGRGTHGDGPGRDAAPTAERSKKSRSADKDGPSHEGGNSSGLSSALSSPMAGIQSSKKGNSESDQSRSSPPHASGQDRSMSLNRQRPRKRKLGDDGADDRDHAASHEAASSQSVIPPANGKAHKKRKVLPPLPLTTRDFGHSDDAHSDSSSAGGSPRRRSQLRKLTATELALMSPAKMPHKKHRDQIGRTFLARACAANETDNARTRLRDRPEDIDIADNAGNTPLQIASLEGSAEIVKLLIEHHCDIDCKNHDKDTPLIDAVENGHLEVVQLLLDAGANPRQGNLNGEEPLDLLDPDDENYVAIRSALISAKNRSNLRRPSEDNSAHNSAATKESGRSSRGASAASPRHSPPMTNPRSPPLIGPPPRRKTVRSEATRNDLLWMKPTAENLRDRAGKGDMAGVANILNVLSQADTESLIAAARGGHDEVIQLLLGIGGADADADPVESQKEGFNTPILAAIGRGNEKVIQLLLEQRKFDPTRRDHRGRTYYEVARDRQGLNWEKEYEILRSAYESKTGGRKPAHSGSSKSATQVTARANRDGEKDKKHPGRPEASSHTESAQKKKLTSPANHGDTVRRDSTTKETRRDVADKAGISKHKGSQSALGAIRGQPRPDEGRHNSVAVVDGESSAARPPKSATVESRRRESDATTAASEGEGAKPRRKLVSGKVLKGDRETKRRESNASATSHTSTHADADERAQRRPKDSTLKSKTRPSSSGKTETEKSTIRLKASASDSELPGEGAVAKAKAAKRADSKDRLSAVRGEGGTKRPRSSESPVRSRSRESETRRSDAEESKKKRRRLESEGKDRHKGADTDRISGGGAEARVGVAKSSRSPSDAVATAKKVQGGSSKETVGATDHQKHGANGKGRVATQARDAEPVNSKIGHAKRHEPGIERTKDSLAKRDPDKQAVEKAADEKRMKVRREKEAAEQKAKENRELQDRLDRERAEQLKREQAEAEERAARMQAMEELKKAEEQRRRAEAEERAMREQAEKEDAERKIKIARAEEALAEEKRRVEEAERQARLAREEDEARAERKRREEEMHRRRAEQNRQRREEAERRRVELEQREAMELQRRQEEQERARREALPFALQRLAELPSELSRTPEEAKEFLPLYTVTLRQLDPGSPDEQGAERWVINFQAAVILGVKDVALPQYTGWERRPITERHKVLLWRVARTKLQSKAPLELDGLGVMARDRLTQAKFRAMESVFWIKLADLQDIVPRYPHLQGVKMSTLALQDLDRQDGPPTQFSLTANADGWTMTAYENGTYSSYTPSINRQIEEYRQHGSGPLFRPVFEPAAKKTPGKVVPNGVAHH